MDIKKIVSERVLYGYNMEYEKLNIKLIRAPAMVFIYPVLTFCSHKEL